MKRSLEEVTASNLPVLPPEIWDHIISLCSLYDFQTLKMTCRGFSEGVVKEIKKIESGTSEFDSMEMTFPYRDAYIREPMLYPALYQRWDRSTHSFIDALNIFMQNILEYKCIFSFRYRGDNYNIVRHNGFKTIVQDERQVIRCYCHRLNQKGILERLKGIIEKAIDASFLYFNGPIGIHDRIDFMACTTLICRRAECHFCYNERLLLIQHPYVKKEIPMGLLSDKEPRITKYVIRRPY